MPQQAEGIFAQYLHKTITLARQPGGVSRPDLMTELDVSRSKADALINEARLRKSKTVGRTQYFSPTNATKRVLAEVGEEVTSNGSGDEESEKEQNVVNQKNQGPEVDPKALFGAMLGEGPVPEEVQEQPAQTTGHNRLPPKTPEQPASRKQVAATRPSVAAAPAVTKSAAGLDEEIKAIRNAIQEAESKAQNGHMTWVTQTAHANALGLRLQRALEQRLSIS